MSSSPYKYMNLLHTRERRVLGLYYDPWHVHTYDDPVHTKSTNNLVTVNIVDTITNPIALVNLARTQVDPTNLVEFRVKFFGYH